jgi:predicted transcriptional regulator
MTKKQATSGTALNIRASEELTERLDKLAAKYPLTKHAIAKIALGRGLDAIESDPRWFEKAGKAK